MLTERAEIMEDLIRTKPLKYQIFQVGERFYNVPFVGIWQNMYEYDRNCIFYIRESVERLFVEISNNIEECNHVVMGSPGSGKTISVWTWAMQRAFEGLDCVLWIHFNMYSREYSIALLLKNGTLRFLKNYRFSGNIVEAISQLARNFNVTAIICDQVEGENYILSTSLLRKYRIIVIPPSQINLVDFSYYSRPIYLSYLDSWCLHNYLEAKK
jgi:hypothetical protein